MSLNTRSDKLLGSYLKDRRSKLDPAALNLPAMRRRTPGLRREEVAQRAHVSVTWYTWLEQGRGGAPSADLLDRLASALALEEAEREHLYLLAQNRPPELRSLVESVAVSSRTQRVLDALETSPALVKDPAWNVLAWNEAAAAVLIDYASLQPSERNILRLLFSPEHLRWNIPDWEDTARFVIASFRAETTRAGISHQAQALIDELSHSSPEFASMWQNQNVRRHGEGTKRVRSTNGDLITLEYSSFAVDGRPGLSMVIYVPSTSHDTALVRSLIAKHRSG